MRMASLLPMLLFLIFVNMSLPLSGESDETCGAPDQAVHRPCMRRAIRTLRDLRISGLDRPAEAVDTDLRPRSRSDETLPVCVDGARIRKIPAQVSGVESPSEDD